VFQSNFSVYIDNALLQMLDGWNESCLFSVKITCAPARSTSQTQTTCSAVKMPVGDEAFLGVSTSPVSVKPTVGVVGLRFANLVNICTCHRHSVVGDMRTTATHGTPASISGGMDRSSNMERRRHSP